MDTMDARSPRVLVLGYHRITELSTDTWSLCVTPARFAEQLRRICARGRPRLLEDVVRHGPSSDPTIVVTFDDGYADTLWAAKPLLEQFDVPATVFLPTAYIGSDREFWWDALEHLLLTPGPLPQKLCVTIGGRLHEWTFHDTVDYGAETARLYRNWRAWEQAPTERHAAYREMWALLGPLSEETRKTALDELFAVIGMEPAVRETHRLLRESEVLQLAGDDLIQLGSHSVTHSMLASKDTAEQHYEITASKARLEALVGRPVTTFAYPFGHYTAETAALTRDAGFLCACANFPGLLAPHTNRYEVPRLQMHDCDGEEFERLLDPWLA
jgi:peptidoglycan/xylan/chitin deacetylase (PgdA/CDA1 family)